MGRETGTAEGVQGSVWTSEGSLGMEGESGVGKMGGQDKTTTERREVAR